MYYYSALQPKDCTHHTPYSTDFGVIKIEHRIASGGRSPPDPLLQRSMFIFKTLSRLQATMQMCNVTYVVALPNVK